MDDIPPEKKQGQQNDQGGKGGENGSGQGLVDTFIEKTGQGCSGRFPFDVFSDSVKHDDGIIQ